ncbi:MAG: Hsp20/alpha crystallin family protein [Candidatus Zixiibacteriota bacterium]
MTLVRFNPNMALARANRDFDGMIDSILNGVPTFNKKECCDFSPRVDVIENVDNVIMAAEIPGLEKNEIKIVVEDNVLTISGEKKSYFEDEKTEYVRRELMRGKFSRAFNLPEYVDAEKIKADYKNGVLQITLPKVEKAKPKEISVNVD